MLACDVSGHTERRVAAEVLGLKLLVAEFVTYAVKRGIAGERLLSIVNCFFVFCVTYERNVITREVRLFRKKSLIT